MALISRAEARWDRDLRSGAGDVRGESGAFGPLPVSWAARTETHAGKTSPEELLAAAHASCFAMALSAALARNQHPPEHLDVHATATFDKVGDGWGVTTMELEVRGKVPGIDAARFREIAEGAKDGCPISKALHGNVALRLTATLA